MTQRLPKQIQQELDRAAALEASLASPPPQPEAPIQMELPPLTPTPAPVAPAPEPAPQPTARTDQYWEQRLRTVQGMHDKVVRDLTAGLTELRQQVMEVKAKPVEVPRPAIDPKDVDAFGADMVEMVNKQAERAYAALSKQLADAVQTLDTRMAAIEDRFTGVSNQAEHGREASFYAALESAVPTWHQINEDPKWLEWLAVVDPVYRKSRQDALSAGHASRDAQQVIDIFKAFLKEQPKPRPVETLATQVAPGNSGAASAPTAPAVKRIIGQQEIAGFYNDVARGKYKGRDAEAKKYEAEINLALEEGRVR